MISLLTNILHQEDPQKTCHKKLSGDFRKHKLKKKHEVGKGKMKSLTIDCKL